jgi:dihydroneopterin aldolase
MTVVPFSALDGLVPDSLRVRTRQVLIEDMELMVDIGFHEGEIGVPQRVLVTLEIWLAADVFAHGDVPETAFDYHPLRAAIRELAVSRRFNLQETLAQAIYEQVAARLGVLALRVTTRKPDIYPDCRSAGVSIASF